jgi:hypothetical protein
MSNRTPLKDDENEYTRDEILELSREYDSGINQLTQAELEGLPTSVSINENLQYIRDKIDERR